MSKSSPDSPAAGGEKENFRLHQNSDRREVAYALFCATVQVAT